MTVIDQRVIEMGMDNKGFETGVKESVKWLDQLKEGLKLDNSAKSLQFLASVARTFSIQGISEGVGHISASFSALGGIGLTVMQNITNSVINLTQQLGNTAIGLDHIKMGFANYEIQMNAVQTVLANTASKGTTLNDVNKALADMNDYANKTIFVFADMAKNLGTFTAAGVGLQASTTAIKGIANLAALSGSSAQQAAALMYQLSQALSKGRVQLQDWISVNNAGVGGQVFQDALKETARSQGIAVDAMIKKAGSFTESLQSGWLTSSVLEQTLANLSGDMTRKQLENIGKDAKGTAAAVTQTWGIQTENQLKSMLLTADQLHRLGNGWEHQANAISSMSAKQLKAFGITEAQLKILGGAAQSQAAKGGKYSKEQIDNILKTQETALSAAQDVKTLTQMREVLGTSIDAAWAKTFEILFGDINEAKGMFTDLTNIFGGMLNDSAKYRNDILQGWKDVGGRTLVIEGLTNLLKDLDTIVRAIAKAFMDIFPAPAALTLGSMSVDFRNFTRTLAVTTFTADKITRGFKGIFSIFSLIGKVIGTVVGAFFKLNGVTKITSFDFLDVFARVGDFLSSLNNPQADAGKFGKAMAKVREVVTTVSNAVTGFVEKARPSYDKFIAFITPIFEKIKYFFLNIGPEFEKFKTWITPFIDKVKEIFGKVGEEYAKFVLWVTPIFDKVKLFFSGVKDEVKKFYDFIKPKFDKIKSFVVETFGSIKNSTFYKTFEETIKKLNPFPHLLENIGKAFTWIKDTLTKIEPFFKGIGEKIKTFIAGFGTGVKDGVNKIDTKTIFGGLLDKIKEVLKKLSFKDIATIVVSGLLVALGLSVKDFFSKGSKVLGGAGSILDGVSGILDGVKDSLKAWQKDLQAKTLMTIAEAIAILTISLIALSFVDKDKLANAIGSMTLMFVGLMTSMETFKKDSGKTDLSKMAKGLLMLAGAILVMTVAVMLISTVDPTKITTGITAIGVLLLELAIFMRILPKDAEFKMAGILSLAGAIVVLVLAVKLFGTMNIKELTQGLQAVGIMLGEIGIFLNLVNEKSLSKAGGLILLAGALVLLSAVILALGLMPPEVLSLGMLSILGLLAMMTAFLMLLSEFAKDAIVGAAAMVIVSGALSVLAGLIFFIGTMKPEVAVQGVSALVILLATMVAGLTLMETTLAGSAAMVVAAIALGMMVPVLFLLGQLKVEQLAIGLAAIAGVFLIFGVAGSLLTPIVPIIAALGAAILLFGLAGLAAGVGMLAFATGLGALVLIGQYSLTTIKAMLGELAASFASAIITFAQTIAAGAIPLAAAVVEIVKVMLATLLILAPSLEVTVLALLAVVLTTIVGASAMIVQAGMDLLVNFLKGIGDNLFRVLLVAGDLITKFIDGVAYEIPNIITSAFKLLLSFINGMTDAVDEYATQILEAAGKLVKAIIMAIATALADGIRPISEAIGKMVTDAIYALWRVWLSGPGKKADETGAKIPDAISNGIKSGTNDVVDQTKKMGSEVVKTLSSVATQATEAFSINADFTPTIRPVVDLTDVTSGSKKIAGMFTPPTITTSLTANKATIIAGGMARLTGGINNFETDNRTTSETPNITFTQNNYSPEALSRLEIYRQTRSQLAMLKGLTKS
jgi:tape measure domain-containing protein